MSDELKLCPFCGGEGDMSWFAKGDSSAVAGYFVECCSCSAGGEPFDIQGEMPDRDDYTRQKAIAAWNRRATPQPPEVEGLRRALEFYRDQWDWFAVGDEPDLVHGGGGITGYEAEPRQALKDDGGKRAAEALALPSPPREQPLSDPARARMMLRIRNYVRDYADTETVEVELLAEALAALDASPPQGDSASVAESASEGPVGPFASDSSCQSEGEGQ